MKIILLSGGSGERLWPLSNGSRSKQFLQVMTDEHGCRESMVQRIYRQLSESVDRKDIVIAVDGSQEDSVRRQLGTDVTIVSEPERRGTYPAIMLACSYLWSRGMLQDEEAVAVLPVDTYVENDYFTGLQVMEQAVCSGWADVMLMGVCPTYPSAKYGYLFPGAYLSEQDKSKAAIPVRKVERFTEKPSETEAAVYMEQGAMWNAGVFVVRTGWLQSLCNYDLRDYEMLRSRYAQLDKKAFDYCLEQQDLSMGMITYTGKWKDLGTWNTLTEEMQQECSGEVILGENCENTHAMNELSIPMVVLGAKNMVVAASPDGILVSDKHSSSYLAPYIEQVNNRPMYELRKWGEYKVLDYIQYEDGNKSLTKHLTVEKGKSISYQMHHCRDEIWTIVDGTGELLIDGEVRKVCRGEVAYIRKGQKHAMRALTNLQFIEVQIGMELVEEDIERFAWIWQ